MVVPLVPPAVHTNGVVVENVTARLDDEVAPTVTGTCNTPRSPRAANVIVWSALITLKLCATGGAAAKTASPAWSAWTVHVPAADKVMLVPSALQTVGVVVENVTASPELADAVTATGDCSAV